MLEVITKNIGSLTLIQVLGLVGIGSFIDIFISNKRKEIMYNYLTKQNNVGFGEFESQIITFFIEKLCLKSDIEKLSYFRIYAFNCICWFLLFSTLLFVSGFYPENVKSGSYLREQFRNILYFFESGILGQIAGLFFKLLLSIVLSLIAAAMSFPLDFMSTLITKKLFYYKSNRGIIFVRNIIIDILFSLTISFSVIVIFVIISIVSAIINFYFNFGSYKYDLTMNDSPIFYTVQAFISFGSIFSFINNVFINIIQVIIVISSLFIRFICSKIGYGHFVFILSNYPATVIFTFSFVILFVFDLII